MRGLDLDRFWYQNNALENADWWYVNEVSACAVHRPLNACKHWSNTTVTDEYKSMPTPTVTLDTMIILCIRLANERLRYIESFTER